MVADIGKTIKTVSKVIYVHNITVKFKQQFTKTPSLSLLSLQ